MQKNCDVKGKQQSTLFAFTRFYNCLFLLFLKRPREPVSALFAHQSRCPATTKAFPAPRQRARFPGERSQRNTPVPGPSTIPREEPPDAAARAAPPGGTEHRPASAASCRQRARPASPAFWPGAEHPGRRGLCGPLAALSQLGLSRPGARGGAAPPGAWASPPATFPFSPAAAPPESRRRACRSPSQRARHPPRLPPGPAPPAPSRRRGAGERCRGAAPGGHSPAACSPMGRTSGCD